MGLIRGGLVFILGFALFLSLFFGNLFLTLNLSLSYENIQPNIISFVGNQSDESLTGFIEEAYIPAALYCLNNTDYVFSYEENAFSVPCNVILEGEEETINYGVNKLVENVYYKDYSCGFFECLNNEEYFFLISDQSREYFEDKFYIFLFISLIIIAVMFFLEESKSNVPIVVGVWLLLSSLPFMKLNSLFSFLDDSILQFIPIIFSESYTVFLSTFILSIILIAAGILFKFFNVGNFILDKLRSSNDSNKQVKIIKTKKKNKI